jgi:hypothetical protein
MPHGSGVAYAAPPGPDADDAAQRAFLIDVGRRKEFRAFAPWKAAPASEVAEAVQLPAFYCSGRQACDSVPSLPGLRLHGGQEFVANFADPDTPYTRLLLNWRTGAGKSIAVAAIASEYATLSRARLAALPGVPGPRVVVVGFSGNIIRDELLRHPEFGFVSRSELAELTRLRLLALAAPSGAPEAKQYSGFLGGLRRRITDPARGGFYKFFGYKEFANKLFTVTKRGLARGFRVQSLFRRRVAHPDAKSARSARRKPLPLQSDGAAAPAGALLETIPVGAEEGEAAEEGDDELAPDRNSPAELTSDDFLARIADAVDEGLVKVSAEIVDLLRGGLMVCDEIHNTYNMQEANNYGVALQYVLDALSSEHDAGKGPGVRALFLTATVTSGAAAEVVDLLNLLLPPGQRPRVGNARPRLRRSDFFKTEGADENGRGGRLVPVPGAIERIGSLSAGRVSYLFPQSDAAADRQDRQDGNAAREYPTREFEGTTLVGPYGEIPYLRFTECAMSEFQARTVAAAVAPEDGKVLNAGSVPAGGQALYEMVFPNPELGPDAACGPDGTGLFLSDAVVPKLRAAPQPWRQTAGVVIESATPRGDVSVAGGPYLSAARGCKDAPPGVGAYSGKYLRLVQDLHAALQAGPGKITVYHNRVRTSGVLLIAALLRENGFADETEAPSQATRCAVCGVAKRDHAARAKDTPAHAYAPARFIVVNSELDRAQIERSLARYNAPSNDDGSAFRVLVGSRVIREAVNLRAVRLMILCSLPTDVPTLIQVVGRAVRRGSHASLPPDQRTVRVRILVSTAPAGRGAQPAAPEVVRYSEKMREYLVTQEIERAIRRRAVDAFLADQPAHATLEALPAPPMASAADVAAAAAADPAGSEATYYAYGAADREVATVEAAAAALFAARKVWTYDDLWRAVSLPGAVAGIAADPAGFTEESFAAALRRLGYARDDRRIARAGQYLVRTGYPASLDVGAITRDVEPPGAIRVDVGRFVASSRESRNFEVRLAEFETTFADQSVPIELAFARYDDSFHYELLRRLVEGARARAAGDEGATPAAVWARASSGDTALSRALALYAQYRIVVRAADIARHAGAAKAARGLDRVRNPRLPVGYLAPGAVKMYAGPSAAGAPSGGWYELRRELLNVGPRYDENHVIVGYFERKGGHWRYKLRPPLKALAAAASQTRDARTLARGAVCESRPRQELEGLAVKLQALTRSAAREAGGVALCAAIRAHMLALELDARRAPGGMSSGTRWVYLPGDALPSF